jgi:hypothetical protein
MQSLNRNRLPVRALSLIDKTEMVLIATMAILLPFDHWFFGHMVNPAPMRVLGFVLTAIWLLQLVLHRQPFRFEYWHLAVTLFLITCFTSAFFSPIIPTPEIPNYSYKLIATLKIVAAMLFFILACHALTYEKLKFFLRIHLYNGAIICTTSLILYFLHFSKIWPYNFALWVDQDIYNFVRIQGVSFEPQRFGAYMLTQLPFFMSRSLRLEIGWRCTNADYALLGIMMITTLLSYAMSTYIALPVLIFLLYGTSRCNWRTLIWGSTGLLAVAVMLISIPVIREATIEIITVKMQGQSMSTRHHNWGIAYLEYLTTPWTGVGPESYSYFYPFFDRSAAGATPSSHPPHGIYFGLLANLGMPGVLAFFSMIVVFAATLARRIIAMTTNRSLAYTLAIISLSHFLVQFTIWLPWSLNQWLYMAMAWAALQTSPAASQQTTQPTARTQHAST